MSKGHKTSVRVDEYYWDLKEAHGVTMREAVERGIEVMAFLDSAELRLFTEIIAEKKQASLRAHRHKMENDPEMVGDESNHQGVLLMLYREYKNTLEMPEESIARVAQQKGIPAKELKDELVQLIWG